MVSWDITISLFLGKTWNFENILQIPDSERERAYGQILTLKYHYLPVGPPGTPTNYIQAVILSCGEYSIIGHTLLISSPSRDCIMCYIQPKDRHAACTTGASDASARQKRKNVEFRLCMHLNHVGYTTYPHWRSSAIVGIRCAHTRNR